MLRQALSSVGKRGLQGFRHFAAVPAVVSEVSDVLVPEPAPWTNSAAVLHGVNDMRFENFPLPDRTPSGNVRIEIKAVGICGSDVHYWRKVGTLPWSPFARRFLNSRIWQVFERSFLDSKWSSV